MGCSPWGLKEVGITERLSTELFISLIIFFPGERETQYETVRCRPGGSEELWYYSLLCLNAKNSVTAK